MFVLNMFREEKSIVNDKVFKRMIWEKVKVKLKYFKIYIFVVVGKWYGLFFSLFFKLIFIWLYV